MITAVGLVVIRKFEIIDSLHEGHDGILHLLNFYSIQLDLCIGWSVSDPLRFTDITVPEDCWE